MGISIKGKIKVGLSFSQFSYMIYKKKILPYIDDDKFLFVHMNVLLNAYEFWRYEKKN